MHCHPAPVARGTSRARLEIAYGYTSRHTRNVTSPTTARTMRAQMARRRNAPSSSSSGTVRQTPDNQWPRYAMIRLDYALMRLYETSTEARDLAPQMRVT